MSDNIPRFIQNISVRGGNSHTQNGRYQNPPRRGGRGQNPSRRSGYETPPRRGSYQNAPNRGGPQNMQAYQDAHDDDYGDSLYREYQPGNQNRQRGGYQQNQQYGGYTHRGNYQSLQHGYSAQEDYGYSRREELQNSTEEQYQIPERDLFQNRTHDGFMPRGSFRNSQMSAPLDFPIPPRSGRLQGGYQNHSRGNQRGYRSAPQDRFQSNHFGASQDEYFEPDDDFRRFQYPFGEGAGLQNVHGGYQNRDRFQSDNTWDNFGQNNRGGSSGFADSQRFRNPRSDYDSKFDLSEFETPDSTDNSWDDSKK